jgi:hypothetical protein
MPTVTIHPPGEAHPVFAEAAPPPPPAPAPPLPAASQPTPQPRAQRSITYATDAQGRQIGWRKLNALEDFDLTEIAGASSSNEEWMLRASLAYGVREINGEAVSRPMNKTQLRALVARLDDDGMAAVLGVVTAVMSDGGEAPGGVERARNFPDTPA